ncbi:MAG: hypothetical protein EXR93_10955 [Gemmatimonadetes bacterium]|nr:hypothetical protein [Gemmatimonadota bacterium]
MRRAAILSGLAIILAVPLAAQNSGYGVLGIGFPTRPTTIQARALGDGPATIDPQSGVNPAALGLLSTLSVSASASQEYRTLTMSGVQTDGLRQARFPYAVMAGRFGRSRLSYSVGYHAFAERTFDLSTVDTLVLRGVPVILTDQNGSAGAVVDSRAAVAWSVNPKLSFGLGTHFIGGSARLTARRTFSDSSYRSYVEANDATFSAFGVSGGALIVPTAKMRIGVSARVNTKLQRSVLGIRGSDLALPASLHAGVDARPVAGVRLAAGVGWRSWSSAAGDVAAGTRAFDTFEAGGGIELGGAPRTQPRFPIRLGIRYATLPFSPTGDQPHEVNLSGGTRVRFAQNRVTFDLGVERTVRNGGLVNETAWQLNLGFEITP